MESTTSFWNARPTDYVLGRIRAGLLEEGTVALLDQVGAGARAHRDGLSTMVSNWPSAARATASI